MVTCTAAICDWPSLANSHCSVRCNPRKTSANTAAVPARTIGGKAKRDEADTISPVLSSPLLTKVTGQGGPRILPLWPSCEAAESSISPSWISGYSYFQVRFFGFEF